MNWQSFASQQFLYKRTGPTNYIKHLQTDSNTCLLSTGILGWDWNVFPSITIKSCNCPCHELWLKFKVQDARWRTARIALTKDTRHGLGNLSMSYLHPKPTAFGGTSFNKRKMLRVITVMGYGRVPKHVRLLGDLPHFPFPFHTLECQIYGLHKGQNLHMKKTLDIIGLNEYSHSLYTLYIESFWIVSAVVPLEIKQRTRVYFKHAHICSGHALKNAYTNYV